MTTNWRRCQTLSVTCSHWMSSMQTTINSRTCHPPLQIAKVSVDHKLKQQSDIPPSSCILSSLLFSSPLFSLLSCLVSSLFSLSSVLSSLFSTLFPCLGLCPIYLSPVLSSPFSFLLFLSVIFSFPPFMDIFLSHSFSSLFRSSLLFRQI